MSLLETMKPSIQDIWKKSGFEEPTSIQLNAVPYLLDGKDMIAKSPTGTGKTLAYLLPVLHKIDEEKKDIQAVILASSQELVMQIHQEIQKWTEGSGINSATFIGGANVKRQLEKLKKRPQIIAGTPGRLQELIKMKKIKMHTVKMIILDEGDQLLVPEHIAAIESIVKSTLNDRQIVLFSATLIEQTEETARKLMRDPVIIQIDKDESKPTVDHVYFVCDAREKIDVLRRIARWNDLKAIAFLKNIGEINILGEKLQFKGIDIGILHSELKKLDRTNTIKSFRSGKFPLLIATDVAARGLDIQGITHVIHVDVPETATQYIHRSGRTGRLGSTTGVVISIVTQREERNLKQIARELDIPLHKLEFVKGEVVRVK